MACIYAGHGLTKSGLIAFFIVLCTIRVEKIFNTKCPWYLVYLGEISYALYLIHVPVKTFIDYYGSYFSFIPHDKSIVLFMFSISISICISILLFNYIEKPFIDLGHRLSKKIKI